MNIQMPKFYEIFIPILKVLSGGETIARQELKKKVRDNYFSHLPKELLEQKISSGDNKLLNRIGWAMSYLKLAKMIIQPSRGLFKITDKGKRTLQKGSLSLKEIFNDPDYLSYNRMINKATKSENISDDTPEDLIESGIEKIEEEVKKNLLVKLKSSDPYYFQKIVLLLLEKMGYGNFQETPKSNDGGIDGIINEDKLGLDKIYIQAKRFNDHNVRELDIRNFIGAMSRDTHKGIFVTTSSFDAKALEKAKDASQKIITIDGAMLVDLMYKYGIGVQIKNTYEVKKLDEDFFEES